GCHLHKRMSGRIWAAEKKRRYFLQRWPSTKSMQRVRQRMKELTPSAAQHRDLRETIAKLNPVLRGWGGYFGTGNATAKFKHIDCAVWTRPGHRVRQRERRHARPGEMTQWPRPVSPHPPLDQLGGPAPSPAASTMPRPARPPVSGGGKTRPQVLRGGFARPRR